MVCVLCVLCSLMKQLHGVQKKRERDETGQQKLLNFFLLLL